MRYIVAIVAAAFILLPGTAHAALSGNDIMSNCAGYDPAAETFTPTDDQQAYKFGRCSGYIDAFVDASVILPTPPEWCIQPTGDIPYKQIRGVVLKWLKDHPEQLHEPAITLFYKAAHEAWPCH